MGFITEIDSGTDGRRFHMSYDQETLNDRINAGFLSDTPTGKRQAFFAWFDAHKDYESFDGHEAQRREQEAGITAMDWATYHAGFHVEF